MNSIPQADAPASGEPELPFHWQKVQSAIWLIGLVILALKGWWWPGILILVAVSGLTQALISVYVKRGDDEKQAAVAEKTLHESARERCRRNARPAEHP